MRCRKCGNNATHKAEHPDGLPGVLHWNCNNCGWSRAITTAPRKVRLPATEKEVSNA